MKILIEIDCSSPAFSKDNINNELERILDTLAYSIYMNGVYSHTDLLDSDNNKVGYLKTVK